MSTDFPPPDGLPHINPDGAEQSVRDSAAEFRAFFELSSVGMAQAEPPLGHLVHVNQKLCDMVGYTAAELAQRELQELTHEEDRELLVSRSHDLVEGHLREFSLDVRFQRKNGSLSWVHVNVTLMHDGEGQPLRTVAVILDIQARKLAEAALHRNEEELRVSNSELDEQVQRRTQALRDGEVRLRKSAETSSRRAQQLRDMAAELASVEQKERRRLAVILHDHIQQMLIAALMRVELARDLSNAELRAQLDAAGTYINDSINATRSLAVELVPPLLYDQGLPAALEWLARQFYERHGLKIHLHCSSLGPTSDNDRDLLYQATRELLLNVVKHAQTTEAWLSVSRHEAGTQLEVRDRGVGCNVEQLQTNQYSFGLFYIRERLEAVGGTLTIESTPGRGTTAQILLP